MLRNPRLVICLCTAVVALSFIAAATAEESSPSAARESGIVLSVTEQAAPMSVDPTCGTVSGLGGVEVEPASVLEGVSQGEAKSGHCRISPSCWIDSQCDDYCGTPGWGACEFGCCACLG